MFDDPQCLLRIAGGALKRPEEEIHPLFAGAPEYVWSLGEINKYVNMAKISCFSAACLDQTEKDP